MIEFYNDELKEKYYKFTHKSGLDVYVFPKNLTSSYALFGVNYGSIDNTFRVVGDERFITVPDGIAHYLEHRMFTQKDGSDITEKFSRCGADSNAYTSFNKTVYLCSATDNFNEALKHLLNFVTEPNFTDELVEKERGIIISEINMGIDDPYNRGFYGALEAMYSVNSARIDIAGTEESVSKITAEMLNMCYNAFYNANNMAVVVCGNITPESVLDIVNKTIPDSFKSVSIERKYVNDKDTFVNKKLYEAKMDVSKPIFTIGVKDSYIPTLDDDRMKKYAAMSIICDMLFSKAGDLYNDLFESGKITPDFSANYVCSRTFAYTMISGESDDPFSILEYIKKYIQSFKYEDSDFNRCKKVLYAEYVKDFDSTEEIANNMIDFIFDGFDLFKFGDVIRIIDREYVDELLRNSFKDEYFAMSVIYPKDTNIERN